MAPQDGPPRKRARASQGPAVLTALLSGTALDDIAKAEGITNRSAERLVRNELRKRWIAPLQDYARLQIARLDEVLSSLKKKGKEGDLPTIDRLLKVLDRLDRYHGFNKFASLATASHEDVRPQLLFKMEQSALAIEGPKDET
jgi:hypothetical protein